MRELNKLRSSSTLPSRSFPYQTQRCWPSFPFQRHQKTLLSDTVPGCSKAKGHLRVFLTKLLNHPLAKRRMVRPNWPLLSGLCTNPQLITWASLCRVRNKARDDHNNGDMVPTKEWVRMRSAQEWSLSLELTAHPNAHGDFSHTLFFIGALQAGNVGRPISFCSISTSHFGNNNKMRKFILPFWKWREESLIFVYWFMLTCSRSGHHHLVTHIQGTPGYRPVILPGASDSVFSTSSVNIHSQISFLRPLALLLSFRVSLVLGRDSSLTSFNSSLTKCNPMNPFSSLSWCFRSYLSFLPLLTL